MEHLLSNVVYMSTFKMIDKTLNRRLSNRPICILHYTDDQLDGSKQMDIMYLDMSEALNKVDHAKLPHYSNTSKLHDWFCSYRRECKQQVTVLGATSQELLVTYGLILFLRFVDYLPNTV